MHVDVTRYVCAKHFKSIYLYLRIILSMSMFQKKKEENIVKTIHKELIQMNKKWRANSFFLRKSF